jgi:hypothetical protein
VFAEIRGEQKRALTSGNVQGRMLANVLPLPCKQGVSSSSLLAPTIEIPSHRHVPAESVGATRIGVFTRISHHPCDCGSETTRGGPRTLLGKRYIGGQVNCHGVAGQCRCVSRSQARSVHDQSQRVADVVDLDLADPRPDGTAPRSGPSKCRVGCASPAGSRVPGRSLGTQRPG